MMMGDGSLHGQWQMDPPVHHPASYRQMYLSARRVTDRMDVSSYRARPISDSSAGFSTLSSSAGATQASPVLLPSPLRALFIIAYHTKIISFAWMHELDARARARVCICVRAHAHVCVCARISVRGVGQLSEKKATRRARHSSAILWRWEMIGRFLEYREFILEEMRKIQRRILTKNVFASAARVSLYANETAAFVNIWTSKRNLMSNNVIT